MPDQVFRSRRVVVSGSVRACSIHVRQGRVLKIGEHDDIPPGLPVQDAGDLVILPGLVDTHVHVNEPGRTEWEGFETATRAAAAGGVTTLLDMPLNSIPATVSGSALQTKKEAATGQCWVDIGFLGGVVPGNQESLIDLWKGGVAAFKCFLIDSGVPEFPAVNEADLGEALARLRHFPARLLAHAELATPMRAAETAFRTASPERRRTYARYLQSRPDAGELEAIELLLKLCGAFQSPVHVVHLATGQALDRIEAARASGLPVSVETCPHYLFFAAEEIPDGATEYKCAPPIRSLSNRERLWDGLQRGLIDMIVSDHSPSPPERKHLGTGDFAAAWGGIASLQLGLAAVWTQARSRGVEFRRLADWMSREPARLAGLRGRKGEIIPGADADLVFWDPEAAWAVDAAKLQHRHKITPYHGRSLRGRVVRTFLRGRSVFDNGSFSPRPLGQCLAANRSV